MHELVDQFLTSIRTGPPNIIISSRLQGEGAVNRLRWPRDRGFSAKTGAIFRLNKRIINDAIDAAEGGDANEFRRFLFLMGISTAHELIHVFVALLTGNERDVTPPPAQFPRAGSTVPASGGESGRYWEGEMMSFLVQAYYNPDHPLGRQQAGDLVAVVNGSNAFILDRNWIRDRLDLDFGSSNFPTNPRAMSWTPVRMTRDAMTMEEVRGSGYGDDFGDRDLTRFVGDINSLPTFRVSSAELRGIMAMANDPRRIRVRA